MAWDDIVVAHVTKHLAANYNAMVAYIKGHKAQHENGGADEISVAGLSGQLADGQTPLAHKTSHQDGGSDELNVGGLHGQLADDQPTISHKVNHQNGGSDEISVAGLSGQLADPQVPLAHQSTHASGGTDAITILMSQVTGLVAALAGKLTGTGTTGQLGQFSAPNVITGVDANTAHNKNFETIATEVKMNGTQGLGISTNLPRVDHVHPTDTSRAPVASPTFTGDPKSVTPAVDDNDTSIATTAFIQNQKGASNPIMDGVAAPGSSTKWTPIDHVHPSDTSRAATVHTHAESDVTNLVTDLAAKAPLASPTFTGDPKAPTPALGDNDTSIATTAFVQGEKIAPNPTLIAQTVASKGGVFNGDFELGSGSVSGFSFSWIGSVNYGWYINSDNRVAGSYDTAVSHSGKQSMKLVYTGTAGYPRIFNSINLYGQPMTSEDKKYLIPIKEGVKYRYSVWVKTLNLTNPNGADVFFYALDESLALKSSASASTPLATQDWTLSTGIITPATGSKYLQIAITLFLGSGTIWVDDISFEEVVEDTTNTSQIPTPLLSTITGVTSVDNIDQSLDSGGAYTNTYALTNAVNEGATHIQTFTPTKNKITKIGIWPVAGGTGVDWTLVIHDASNRVIASNVIAAASIVTGAMQYFDVPCLWSSGNYHFHLYASATTGTPTCKANTSNDLETASFIQTYAKPTESATIIANGEKIELSTDEDGLLHGAIIDLDKGKYLYDSGEFTDANGIVFANNVYSADAGGSTSTSVLNIIRGWQLGGGNSINSVSNSVGIIVKVNTFSPIKHLKVSFGTYYGGLYPMKCDISLDGINFSSFIPAPTSGDGQTLFGDSEFVNGNSTFYLKFIPTGANNMLFGRAGYGGLKIEADLDTSSIPQPIIYPLATNQFAEEVVLPSTASRVYYRTAKFSNKNGVVIPHLEFTDSSGVFIKAIPCKIDNTGETNPAINIVIADTLYGQQSGTGSNDSTTGYILNDGEYMTFSTATQYAKVTYKVGGGTTAFANITKNRIYLSSNGSANSATKDPSHQMGVNLWYRVQSVVRAVSDLTEKVSNISIGLPKFNASYVADGGTVTHQIGRIPGIVIAISTTSAEFVSVTAKDALAFTVAIKKHDGTAGTTQIIYWVAM